MQDEALFSVHPNAPLPVERLLGILSIFYPRKLSIPEVWEEGATGSYWWNASLRESSPVKPLAFEEYLVGMRFWLTRPASGGETGQGQITRWEKKIWQVIPADTPIVTELQTKMQKNYVAP